MLAEGAPSIAICPLSMSSSSQILLCGGFDSFTRLESLPQRDHAHFVSSDESSAHVALSENGEFLPQVDEDSSKPTPLGDGSCKLSYDEEDCNPTGERQHLVDGKECASGIPVKPDGPVKREECAMQVKQDGSEDAFDTVSTEKAGEVHETEPCADDDNHAVKSNVDADACITQMDKLSTNSREEQESHVGGQGELTPTNQDMQKAVLHVQTAAMASDNNVLNSPVEKQTEEQRSVTPPPRKPAAWRTPERKPRAVTEAEFVMEASSWPTLAEARHAKPSEARSSPSPSPSHKETIAQVSSSAEKENSMEAPRQLNTNHAQPGPKYRSSYKKGGVAGNNRPNFPPTENMPIPPMGAHVPSVNTFYSDQPMKGNVRGGMNNFFPSPYQVPANGPFYQHRGEGLAPFPHNSPVMPQYGRGHLGWQHYDRGVYGAPAYDQQYIGARHMQPSMVPYMNFNAVHYSYPNYLGGDMSYIAPAYPPASYNFPITPPYSGPSGPQGGGSATQGLGIPTLLVTLRRQIDYYFSEANLVGDTYLKSKMDEEDFVPLSLIANFRKVRDLTSDSMLILEALKNSSVVEVKNGRLRSRVWRRPPSATLYANGVENVDRGREQGAKEGGFDKKSSVPESKMAASSCVAAPWTGLPANLGARSMPAATSIDLK